MGFTTGGKSGCGWIGLMLMGLLFTAIGIGVGWFVGKPILDEAKASESWPTVRGEVIESELERRRNNKGNTSYGANVVYRYEVDDQELEGDNIWFGQFSSSDRSEMQKLVKQYPVGEIVDVYYMPDDPGESVLQPGAFTSSYIVLGIGSVFAVVGLLMLAIPAIKFLFFGALLATSSSDDFVGGSSADQSSFGGDSLRDPRFDDDPRFRNSDDDGFDGIPGA